MREQAKSNRAPHEPPAALPPEGSHLYVSQCSLPALAEMVMEKGYDPSALDALFDAVDSPLLESFAVIVTRGHWTLRGGGGGWDNGVVRMGEAAVRLVRRDDSAEG